MRQASRIPRPAVHTDVNNNKQQSCLDSMPGKAPARRLHQSSKLPRHVLLMQLEAKQAAPPRQQSRRRPVVVRTTLTVRRRIANAQARRRGTDGCRLLLGAQRQRIVALHRMRKANLAAYASQQPQTPVEAVAETEPAAAAADVSMDLKRFIRFHCCDHKVIHISTQLITRYSLFMRERLARQQQLQQFLQPVVLYAISSATLQRIVMWMKRHRKDELTELARLLPQPAHAEPPNWDVQFLGVDLPQLVQLILAANYLGIDPLISHANHYFAELLARRSNDEQLLLQRIMAKLHCI